MLLLVWQRATTVHDLGFKDTAGSVKIQNYTRERLEHCKKAQHRVTRLNGALPSCRPKVKLQTMLREELKAEVADACAISSGS